MLATTPLSAALAEMPNYDVDAYCKRVADLAGSSQQMLKLCIAQEQRSYDHLKPDWDRLPSTMRSYCDRVANAAGQSFHMLELCIAQEQAAKRDNDGTKFKR
jgi:hypothetical protein